MDKTYEIGQVVRTTCRGKCPKDGWGLGLPHNFTVIAHADEIAPGAVRIACVDCGNEQTHNLPFGWGLDLTDEEDDDSRYDAADAEVGRTVEDLI